MKVNTQITTVLLTMSDKNYNPPQIRINDTEDIRLHQSEMRRCNIDACEELCELYTKQESEKKAKETA